MKQLTGLDATFLYMETGTTFGHVNGLSVFRRPDDPDWSPYEAFRRQLERRIPLLEPLRRRVVEVPFQLDHPYWIEDPDFDLDYHLRSNALPAPGDDRALAALVGRIIGRPLDRAHPLWETHVIEGLEGDRFAVLTKIHHATVDGASGAELMTILFDPAPDTPDEGIPDDDRRPEPVPSPATVLGRALVDMAGKPRKLVRLQLRSLRALGELTRNRGLTGLVDLASSVPNPLLRRPASEEEPDTATPPRTGRAPATPFNRSITPHRRLELRNASLDDVKAIKNALGATVNDVIMAVCAGGLRRYLQAHDALPADPLVAMIPVSIRTGEEEERWTNRVSAIFSSIPTDVDDPVARVWKVHHAMEAAKDRFLLMPADVMTDYTQFSPPALATRAMRLATRLKIGDRLNPPFNLVISNVPGPRSPLYLAGAELEHYYPVSTIGEGQGLNITVQSYLDRLDFAFVGCRELLPDLDLLADLVLDELAGLLATAQAGVAAADA
ncbi:MAG TPA: wax ester/triacylglycerol synthase family O-acyltransferase [Acidimicrobiales bacterium]|nr:wax ester/triacylglycerol synthase family O-acyltransferase [Acidimicrobiales bacterium]